MAISIIDTIWLAQLNSVLHYYYIPKHFQVNYVYIFNKRYHT